MERLMKLGHRLAILLAAAAAAFAQTAEVLSTPRLGFTVTGDGTEIRALLGVPGAGRVSDPLVLPEGVTRVYLAPGHDYALGYGEESGRWNILSLRDDSLFSLHPVDGLSGEAGAVVFAPGAEAVAVTDATNSTVHVLTVSNHSAQAAWSAAIEAASRLALNRSGDLLLAAGASGVTLYRRGSDGVQVAATQDVAGIAFQYAADTAVIADAAQRVLLVLEDLSAEPVSHTLVSAGIGAPEAVAWSRDGRLVWCADGDANSIARVNVASGAVDRIATDVAVTQFDVLPGTDHFLISSPRAGEAAWLFLAGPERVSTYFVPGNPQGARQ
jgi:hypothetical protein